jgi:predicted Holliday junction resolvase-like endonuclease
MDASGFFTNLSPFLIPITGLLMPVFIVAIVFWHKSREKELQAHMELRQREMEHQQKMKQLELEIEKTKAAQSREPAGKIGS